MKHPVDAAAVHPLSFGWFDGVVIILLFIGFYRGRKHGMSQEILLVLQWLLIVVLGAQYYQPLGQMVYDLGIIGPLACYWLVYIGIAMVLKIVFTNLKRFIGEKLFASDVFGKWEFYLGMFAGVMRYACWIIFFLAILNGRAYTDQEIVEAEKRQTQELGSTFFPPLTKIQDQILKGSATGALVREHLDRMLIRPTSPNEGPKPAGPNPAKKRENAVNEVLENKPTNK